MRQKSGNNCAVRTLITDLRLTEPEAVKELRRRVTDPNHLNKMLCQVPTPKHFEVAAKFQNPKSFTKDNAELYKFLWLMSKIFVIEYC